MHNMSQIYLHLNVSVYIIIIIVYVLSLQYILANHRNVWEYDFIKPKSEWH